MISKSHQPLAAVPATHNADRVTSVEPTFTPSGICWTAGNPKNRIATHNKGMTNRDGLAGNRGRGES